MTGATETNARAALTVGLVAAPQVGGDAARGDELLDRIGFGVVAGPGQQGAVARGGGHELFVGAVLDRVAVPPSR